MKIFIAVCALICFANAKRIELAPHHADLLIFDNYGNTFPGSGVIVSLKHVLTVAININRFVKWEVTHGNPDFGQETFSSKMAFVHPDFDAASLKNNLGVIKLLNSFKITPATLPVGLPTFNAAIPNTGDYGLVASYQHLLVEEGKKQLRYGPHQVVQRQDCEKLIPGITHMSDYFCVTQQLFTACGGSEGTGFIMEENSKRVLGGIMSYGNIWEDCSKSKFVTYIRISPYVNWIRQNIK